MILYHHSTVMIHEFIRPVKLSGERDHPALVYLHEDKDMPFPVDGLLSHFVYEVHMKSLPAKILYDSKSWLRCLIEAQQQGVDLNKLHWTNKPVRYERVFGT